MSAAPEHRRGGWLKLRRRLRAADGRARVALRVLLSAHVANGLCAALGLLVISAGVQWWLGAVASSAASVGVIACIPPDQPAPRRGKLAQLLPAALLGLPLFWAGHALHGHPWLLGLLLVPASFGAFLAGAWGKRGLPIVVSAMFSLIFAMAVRRHGGEADAAAPPAALCFALGAGLYLLWATVANALLNSRYRVALLAEVLFTLSGLMRQQVARFVPGEAGAAPATGGASADTPALAPLLRRQAALTDQLQAVRDVVLESPRTPRRRRQAALLMHVLELRDLLLACELDLDALRAHPAQAPVLAGLRTVLRWAACDVRALADALLTGRVPAAAERRLQRLQRLPWDAMHALTQHAGDPGARLARSLANRVRHVADEVARAVALARGEREPDLAAVRVAWQLFVSPTAWSWRPLLALWRRDAPPLRHAVRAALALGSAYALAQALPWGTHEYWILLTIVVVLRGSLAQTLERRNSRVAGTLVGCVLSGALLAAHPAPWVLLLALTLAQAVAHAFAVRHYLVTSVAATVLGLVQAHLLGAGTGPVFDIVERMADTLIGVALAWGFSYVLPSWERRQLPALLGRVLRAQARHARIALAVAQLQAVDNEPELQWRLARREAYDSLSALVQATQRALVEPRAVQPPLQALERVLTLANQLLAQLTAIKTMLLLRRGRLDLQALRGPLERAVAQMAAALEEDAASAPASPLGLASSLDTALPVDLPDDDLNPWVLRRLALATGLAAQLGAQARPLRQSF